MYCKDILTLKEHGTTFEGRTLFSVIVEDGENEKPTIMLDAGQEAGAESVGLALYFIQMLVACEDYTEMINKVRWIVLPSTNPDGMEYALSLRPQWRKTMITFDDNPGIGVDISRNFNSNFDSCDKVDPGSPTYAGNAAASENETKLISEVISQNSANIDAYVSLRRDGHAILYPSAYDEKEDEGQSRQAAEKIALRVNQRSGSIRVFSNSSIYYENSEKRCGHSVDFAASQGIKICLEMRVFHGAENIMTEQFQNLPRGYTTNLQTGYFAAIRELYNIVVTKKQGDNSQRLFKKAVTGTTKRFRDAFGFL